MGRRKIWLEVACDCLECEGATAPISESRLKHIDEFDPARRARFVHSMVTRGGLSGKYFDDMPADHIAILKENAAAAPRLTEAQRDRLRALFTLPAAIPAATRSKRSEP